VATVWAAICVARSSEMFFSVRTPSALAAVAMKARAMAAVLKWRCMVCSPVVWKAGLAGRQAVGEL